jgi:hypothetical protein
LIVQGEAVIPRRGKYAGLKIFQRFHFSSALKRMSVVSGYTLPGTSETKYICTVKVTPDGDPAQSLDFFTKNFGKEFNLLVQKCSWFFF